MFGRVWPQLDEPAGRPAGHDDHSSSSSLAFDEQVFVEALHHVPETWGTVAYLVSRRGAARLLAATTRGKCERAVDETIMKLVRDGGLESYCATDLLCGTAGQLDPTQDPAATPLGSNVWGARTLAGSLAADADSDLDG